MTTRYMTTALATIIIVHRSVKHDDRWRVSENQLWISQLCCTGSDQWKVRQCFLTHNWLCFGLTSHIQHRLGQTLHYFQRKSFRIAGVGSYRSILNQCYQCIKVIYVLMVSYFRQITIFVSDLESIFADICVKLQYFVTVLPVTR